MYKTAAIRLSEKDNENLEKLKKAYNISNTSELIRILIRKDTTNLETYEGLKHLSDKQIVNLNLYNNDNTKRQKRG